MPRILTPTAIQDFREALCDAAVQLFSETGFDGFHMRELGMRAGVSPMTPYRYFRDKNDILEMVRMRAFGRLADQLEAVTLGEAEAPVGNLALSTAYIRFAREEESHYRLMFDLGATGIRHHGISYPQEVRLWTVLERHASQVGRLDPDSPLCQTIGQLIFAVLHGTVLLHLSGRLSGQLEKIAEENLNAINIAYFSDSKSRLSPYPIASSAGAYSVHLLSRDGGLAVADNAMGEMNG